MTLSAKRPQSLKDGTPGQFSVEADFVFWGFVFNCCFWTSSSKEKKKNPTTETDQNLAACYFPNLANSQWNNTETPENSIIDLLRSGFK